MTEHKSLLVETLKERKLALDLALESACREVGRDPSEVTIVAVTKMVDNEIAKAAVEAGFTDLGENRPQELVAKAAALSSLDGRCRWHLIGPLQRNKVRSIITLNDLIHSVDSLRLMQQISRIAGEEETTANVLLQVNLSGEKAKQGFSKETLNQVFAECIQLPHIRVRGLMTMAPLGSGSAYYHELFNETKRLQEELSLAFSLSSFNLLSMGMSQDYVEAVKAGATHIRIGSEIFSDLPACDQSESTL